MANRETRLQVVVVQYLRTVLPSDAVLFSVPNGGRMSESARKLAAAMGEYPGASDLMLLHRGRLHCIELKVLRNPNYGIKATTYQSPAQRAFQAAVEAAGGAYVVCRTLDDVREALTAWGIPTRETQPRSRGIQAVVASASMAAAITAGSNITSFSLRPSL